MISLVQKIAGNKGGHQGGQAGLDLFHLSTRFLIFASVSANLAFC